MNQQTITLDINKYPAVIEPLYLRQGDKNGTRLVVTLLENGEPFNVGSYGVRLCLSIRDIYYEVEGVANENIAEFLIDESYLQYHGYSLNNYVSVYDGDTVICSTNSFKMVVYADSSSEADPAEIFTNGVQEFLEESQEQVNEAVDRANQAAEAAEGIVLQDVPLMTENIRGGAQIGGSTQTKSGKLEIKLTDSATGETVTCSSASYLARMEKNGMATQNGTPSPDNPIPIQVVEGANLLDTSGVTTYYATADNASFTLAANVPGKSITIPITLEAGTYTISYEIPNGGITSTGNIVKPTNTNWLSNTVTSRTFTLSQDTAFGTLYFSSDCTVTQGAVINIMLVKGRVPQPYVPYGALGLWVHGGGGNLLNVDNGVYKTGAQSNATPRELSGVGTWVGLASNNYLIPSYATDYAVNGNSFTYTSQSSGGYGVGYECRADAGKEYTLSSICTAGATMSASFYNASGVYLSRQQKTATSATDRTTLTFTTPANTAYVVCVFYITGAGVSASFADMMLNEGNEAQPFEPYTSTLTPIDLQGNILASLPDGTKDVLNIDSAGHVTIESRSWVDTITAIWTITTSGSITYAAITTSDPSKRRNWANSSEFDQEGGAIKSTYCSMSPPTGTTDFYVRRTWNSLYIYAPASKGYTQADFDQFVGAEIVTRNKTAVIDLGYIDIPELEDDCTIEVVSSLASSMTATWWTNEAAPIPEAINAIKDLIGGDTQENTREVLQVPNLRESLRVEDTDEQPEGIETEGE